MRVTAIALCVVCLAAGWPKGADADDSALGLSGIVIAPENRCAPYNRRDYPYPQSVEAVIVSTMEGRIYGPYEARLFASTRDTQIEHIVALSEAHDSGLCRASDVVKRRFSRDLANLTLASPGVNRFKSGSDAADWQPEYNACWFAGRVVAVKRKYGLSMDRREAAALERILARCFSTELRFVAADISLRELPAVARGSGVLSGNDVLSRYDSNGNGRITCAEARQHGIAPVPRSHPAYRYMHDGDNDGVVCE